MLKISQIEDLYDIVNKGRKEGFCFGGEELPQDIESERWPWENKNIPRIISVLEFRELAKKMKGKKILTISGQGDPEMEYVKYEEWDNIHYADDPEKYDLHTMNLECKDYDCVMINQVLEHLYNPCEALKNTNRHMKKGGLLYINAPANNIIHYEPLHFYTGFTPMGLGALMLEAGFEVEVVRSWGNNRIARLMFEKNTYPTMENIDETIENPYGNEIICPLIVWALGKKI